MKLLFESTVTLLCLLLATGGVNAAEPESAVAEGAAAPAGAAAQPIDEADLRRATTLQKLDDLADGLERLRMELRDLEEADDEPAAYQSQDYDGNEETLLSLPRRKIQWQPVKRGFGDSFGWQSLKKKRDFSWQALKKRAFGWQAIKRASPNVIEEHMDDVPQHRPSPKFTIKLRDPEALQDELMTVVEQHLLSDLEAAEAYGINPKMIIDDLKRKQTS